MFNSKFNKSKASGLIFEEVDICDKNFLIDYNYFVCNANSPFYIAKHVHEEMEICLIRSGTFEYGIGDETYTLNDGDIYIAQPSLPHSFKNITENGAFCVFVFDAALLNSRFIDSCELKYIIPLSTISIIFDKVIYQNERLSNLFLTIIKEKEECKYGYELIVKGYLLLLLGELFRNYVAKRAMTQPYDEVTKFDKIKNSLTYIEHNLSEEVTLDSVSKMYNVSKQKFCNLFREMTGKTFIEYLNNARIREAISLLETSDMQITRIAQDIGYKDVNYFSRVFKKNMHISPQKYRNKILSKNSNKGIGHHS